MPAQHRHQGRSRRARASPAGSDLRADADPDGLDRGNGHQGLRQSPVELAVPLHVAAEADRHARHHHLEVASERVTRDACSVDGLDHRALRVGVDAANGGIDGDVGNSTNTGARASGRGRRPDAGHVTRDADPEAGQQLAGERSSRDTRRGFARARPLQDVAQVVHLVLHSAREVGVSGPGARHGRAFGPRRGRERGRPTGMVRCQLAQSRLWMTSETGLPVSASAQARQYLGPVAFDLHPLAAPVAKLPTMEVVIHRLDVDIEPGRQPSRMTTSPGPCDSPAVRKRNICGRL